MAIYSFKGGNLMAILIILVAIALLIIGFPI